MDALSDDLNTPLAIATLHEMAANLNKSPNPKKAANFRASGRLMGLLQLDPESWFKGDPGADDGGLSDIEINALILERNKARNAKNFGRSDEIREQLAAAGILLEDGPRRTTWKRA